jgi:FkbH-like protein
MLQALRAPPTAPLTRLEVAVLRNVTVEPIAEFLRYAARGLSRDVELRFGGYDTAWQEATGALPLLGGDTGLVVVFLYLPALAPRLGTDDPEPQIQQVIADITPMLRGIRAQTAAPVLWHGFVLPDDPPLGIADRQSESGQRAAVDRLNQMVRAELRAHPAMYYVDTQLCLERCGRAEFYDLRHWHLSRAPLGKGALRELAGEHAKFLRALAGKNKKCLVLDCDETLWGGIIGEDGIGGIRLGQSYPGSIYRAFQQQVVDLYQRGVIVALCSKNNPEDVWEVFRDHPDMVLREQHIAAAHIAWTDKPGGLRSLAEVLNIGTDSMVFCDDNPFEIDLVRSTLPEVEVILLPADRLTDRLTLLADSGLFDTPAVTQEDRGRGEMYRQEAQRKVARDQATDLDSYLRSLEMELSIGRVDDVNLARVAQLTQRTNQFNLTTRRYSEAELRAELASPDADVVWLRLRDRFGDSGLTGAAVLRYQQGVAHIDSLLLSCRVLGRGVEDAFLDVLLRRCRDRGCAQVVGAYRRSSKNAQVADFYPARGFHGNGAAAGEEQRWTIDPAGARATPPWFKSISADFGAKEPA